MILGICSMLLGLVVSSFLSSEEQAMPALVGMTMVLVVLSGALPLESKGLIAQLSRFVPSHWANNALSASIDLVQLNLISDKKLQDDWQSSVTNLTSCLTIVALFSLVFAFTALLKIKRSR
jgi:ABC-type multidrug transport system permease subunit